MTYAEKTPPQNLRKILLQVLQQAHEAGAERRGHADLQEMADRFIEHWPGLALQDEPLPEWKCPSCGATTRARLADKVDDDELLERVARAIANVGDVERWSNCTEDTREDLRDEARAALTAVLGDDMVTADPDATESA